ncbi:MAG: hypothetical protein WA814_05340, partial [Candidatus Baltobacteraceae bacterium]
MRFTTIAAVAAVVTLAACTESGSSLPRTSSASCRSHTPQSLSSVVQSATAVPQRATAAQLGLWPR